VVPRDAYFFLYIHLISSTVAKDAILSHISSKVITLKPISPVSFLLIEFNHIVNS